jgi:hypothetical protein
MTQFGASLTDDARVINYDSKMFIMQASNKKRINLKTEGYMAALNCFNCQYFLQWPPTELITLTINPGGTQIVKRPKSMHG